MLYRKWIKNIKEAGETDLLNGGRSMGQVDSFYLVVSYVSLEEPIF